MANGTAGAAEQAFMGAIRTKVIRDGVCETVLTRQADGYNSQATGGAKRTAQAVRKQFRALMLALETRVKTKNRDDSACLRWLPRHMRRRTTRSLRISWWRLMRRLCVGDPGAAQNKLELTWLEGLWLGRDSRTSEHLVGTPTGVTRSRVIRRKVADRRWDLHRFDKMTWTPWETTPTTRGRPPLRRSLQELVFLGPRPEVPGPVA